MAARSSVKGFDLTGYPLIFALDRAHQDRGEKKLVERMWIAHSKYSTLNALLFDWEDKIRKEYAGKGIESRMEELKIEIDALFEKYDGVFEDTSVSTEEKVFMKVLRGVNERIDTIAAIAGIIDKLQIQSEDVVFGG